MRGRSDDAKGGRRLNLVHGEPVKGMTIGQLAAYARVTIKAVRHYHRRGLLDEPPRDSSGYRRYSARHAIELVKIKTLTDAGVPLARIQELLAADPNQFAAAIAQIDRRLEKQAEELLRTRERIAALSGGDRLFVSAEVADFLEQLRQVGVSQRTVEMERDLWILMQSVSPAQAAIWLAEKRDALGEPEFLALYLAYDEAFDWSPEDPRLEALAARSHRWLTIWRGRVGRPPVQPPPIARLVTPAATGASSPAWARLTELAREQKAGA